MANYLTIATEGFYFGSQYESLQKAWLQEHGATGHTASVVRKQ